LARTRHHIRVVGSVLVEYCEGVSVCARVSGAVNDSLLSIWRV
jgi:hypothetical protein